MRREAMDHRMFLLLRKVVEQWHGFYKPLVLLKLLTIQVSQDCLEKLALKPPNRYVRNGNDSPRP
jgi:hypothetical protein